MFDLEALDKFLTRCGFVTAQWVAPLQSLWDELLSGATELRWNREEACLQSHSVIVRIQCSPVRTTHLHAFEKPRQAALRALSEQPALPPGALRFERVHLETGTVSHYGDLLSTALIYEFTLL